MKPTLWIAALAALCLALGACSEPPSSSPSASTPEVSSVPAPDPQPEEESTVSAAGLEEMVDQLGFLLRSDWASPDDIPPGDYVLWYGYQLQQSLPSMSGYLLEGEDGFFFPAPELEEAAAALLGVSADHLRSDPDLYREEEQLYRTPAALAPLSPMTVEIQETTREEGALQLSLALHFSQEDVAKVLTLREEDGGLRCRSLVTQ